MSQSGPVEPEPMLSPAELELVPVLLELDELLLELTSAELVIGTEVPGAVSPVVTSPAGLHAQVTPASPRPTKRAHRAQLRGRSSARAGPRIAGDSEPTGAPAQALQEIAPQEIVSPKTCGTNHTYMRASPASRASQAPTGSRAAGVAVAQSHRGRSARSRDLRSFRALLHDRR